MSDEKDLNMDGEDIVLEEDVDEKNPETAIKKIREKLKTCEADKQEYLAGWQRAKADFVNHKKEEEESRKEFKKYANEALILDFLNIADGFARAFKEPSWQNVDKNWQTGIEYLYNNFMSVLKDYNVVPIEAKGKPFNPKEHEAIEFVETGDETQDGIIMEEVRAGYKINEKIIRASQVKVAKHKK